MAIKGADDGTRGEGGSVSTPPNESKQDEYGAGEHEENSDGTFGGHSTHGGAQGLELVFLGGGNSKAIRGHIGKSIPGTSHVITEVRWTCPLESHHEWRR